MKSGEDQGFEAEGHTRGRKVLAVGRVAAQALDAPYVRHPSHGGAADFRGGLLRFAAGGPESATFL